MKWNGLTLKNAFKSLFIHGIICVAVAAVFILILSYQFSLETGKASGGFAHFENAFHRRSDGNFVFKNSNALLDFLSVFRLDLVCRYLGNSVFDFECIKLPIKIPFAVSPAVLSFTLHKSYGTLVAISWLSIAAPLSWLVILRQHAHIHTHIDFMIWYYPFLLFVFLIIGIFVHIKIVIPLNSTNEKIRF